MLVNKIIRCDINGSLEERKAAGEPVTKLVSQYPVTLCSLSDLYSARLSDDVLIIVYANYFGQHEAGLISGVLNYSAARLLVRARNVFYGFYEWAIKHGVSFVPFDISNGITVANCLQCAANGIFLPGNSMKPLSGEFGKAVRDYVDSAETPTIGVLSMPRTGSKSVADSFVLWGGPKVKVFHAHDTSAERLCKIRTQLKSGEPETRRKAKVKAQNYLELKRKIKSCDKLLLVNVERDQCERVISEFVMKNKADIEAFYRGDKGIDSIMKTLPSAILRDSISLRKFRVQFESFGFPAEFTSGLGRAVSIIHGEHTLVVLRTESLDNTLKESGLYSKYVSINSAADRGYGKLKDEFRRDYIGEIKNMIDDASRMPAT